MKPGKGWGFWRTRSVNYSIGDFAGVFISQPMRSGREVMGERLVSGWKGAD